MVTGADSSPSGMEARSDLQARLERRADGSTAATRNAVMIAQPSRHRRRARLPGARAPGRVPALAPARPVRAGSGHQCLGVPGTPRTLASSRSSSMTAFLQAQTTPHKYVNLSCGSCSRHSHLIAQRRRRRPARPDPQQRCSACSDTARGVPDPPAAAGPLDAHRERSHRHPRRLFRGRQVRHRHRAAG